MKIEIRTAKKLPKRTEQLIDKAFAVLPREHLRGIDRVRLVDSINNPGVKNTATLPGLYHPRAGVQPAWVEISIDALLPPEQPLHKRLLSKSSFKANLTALLFSLVGQHYFLTFKHSVKRSQIEQLVRSYTMQQLKIWQGSNQNFRTKLFKPLQPLFEKWAKQLNQRTKQLKN